VTFDFCDLAASSDLAWPAVGMIELEFQLN
jgi:hypothetical protein